jgi:hypothetical protein
VRWFFLLTLSGLIAGGQVIPGPQWYRSATGLLGVPYANASTQEIERLERYLIFSQSQCAALTPQQYTANQTLARSMTGYLASVSANAVDPQARLAAARLTTAFSSFPCAYPGKQPAHTPEPPPKPGDPPFTLHVPDLGKVPDDQQQTAADLMIRYDTDAARSAGVWKNAETMRISLAGRGMALNTQTATAVGRLQLLYEEASGELRDHKWDDALSTLQAAEATTQKVAGSVGQ